MVSGGTAPYLPVQREHGACPLHLVRMRWQWSQARLTLRLTGAEPLRSGLLISAAVVSMVAVWDEVSVLGVGGCCHQPGEDWDQS
jgi:hypothetical protein